MPTIADAGQAWLVTGGVDTHAEVHVAGMVDQAGRVLGTGEFPVSTAGYQAALAWMRGHGELVKVGVEGTGSYGAGLARYLAAEGVEVTEVTEVIGRTGRRAAAAAESIRALQVARRGAVKARTQAGNQLHDLILTAPEQLREKLAALTTPRRVTLAARFRPGDLASPAEAAKAAMAAVARRHQALTAEIAQLDTALEALARHAAPAGFLARAGIGTQVASILLTTAGDNPGRLRTEASFAALCGSSPVDASSGKQRRHRLNRGGDRQANSALWRIVFTRMACDPRTQAYVARRTAEGKTRKEIMRCLKRYVAREIYKALVTQARNPAAGIPLTPAA
jgi:transposase